MTQDDKSSGQECGFCRGNWVARGLCPICGSPEIIAARKGAALATISTPREDEVERVAKALWFDSVDQQGYPNGQPTWDEMLAWPASDRNNRCEEFRSLAKAALATLTPREQTQDD